MTAQYGTRLDRYKDSKNYIIANNHHRHRLESFWNNKKVKDTLGYPVIKKVFDQNGDIILDVGDLVTYQAIQRAKDADVLEQVFKAVYRGNY